MKQRRGPTVSTLETNEALHGIYICLFFLYRVCVISRAQTSSRTGISSLLTALWTAAGCLKLQITGSLPLKKNKERHIRQNMRITEVIPKLFYLFIYLFIYLFVHLLVRLFIYFSVFCFIRTYRKGESLGSCKVSA